MFSLFYIHFQIDIVIYILIPNVTLLRKCYFKFLAPICYNLQPYVTKTKYVTQPAFTCSKLTIETLEQV